MCQARPLEESIERGQDHTRTAGLEEAEKLPAYPMNNFAILGLRDLLGVSSCPAGSSSLDVCVATLCITGKLVAGTPVAGSPLVVWRGRDDEGEVEDGSVSVPVVFLGSWVTGSVAPDMARPLSSDSHMRLHCCSRARRLLTARIQQIAKGCGGE